MAIRAGELRHRVTIEKDTLSAPTGTGQRDKIYSEFAKVWADVKSLSGRELEQARNITATVTHTLHIRYLKDILLTYRVKWGDRILQINAAIDPENRRRELFLYCTEEVV
jgi:SPP1 family predicted phage head-tail adaptor